MDEAKYTTHNDAPNQGQQNLGDHNTNNFYTITIGPPAHVHPSEGSPSPQRLWNIPFPHNPFFTGQEAILRELHDRFQRNLTMALSQPQAASGLGGIGKTQIAIEYAHRYQHKYQYVLWCRADT